MAVLPQIRFVEPVLRDPVLSEAEFPLRRTFFPLGFPLRLETNSQDVMDAAIEAWGLFPQAFDRPAARMCLGASESDTMIPHQTSTFRSREHLMSVFANSENFVTCDFSQSFAFGWVTRAVAADHALLRYRFLTMAGKMLMEQLALAPLHGALVIRNGSGVLLCGESFAGKSTLAYASSRAGWTFVSDDATSLVRESSDRRALGDPFTIHFREDARRLFPELEERIPGIRPNGKIGIEVFTRDLPVKTALECPIEHVVFLNRQESERASVRRYPEDQALAQWERHAAYGTETVREAQKRCYRRLLGAGLWEMQYTDLYDAVARLEQLVDSGS